MPCVKEQCFCCDVNLLLDTNYMFLMYADPGNPLYLFEQMWGNHLYGFPILITAVLIVRLSNPCLLCLLCWQAGSLPLIPPGKLVVLLDIAKFSSVRIYHFVFLPTMPTERAAKLFKFCQFDS